MNKTLLAWILAILAVIIIFWLGSLLTAPTPAHAQEITLEPAITITVQCMIGYEACAAFTARLRGFANNYPNDIQVVTSIAETLTYAPIVSITIYNRPFWKSNSKNAQWKINDNGHGRLLRVTISKARRALLSLPKKPSSSNSSLFPAPRSFPGR